MCEQTYRIFTCRVCHDELSSQISTEICADGETITDYHDCKNGYRMYLEEIDKECEECREKREKQEAEAKKTEDA